VLSPRRRRRICEALVASVVALVTARFVLDDLAGLAEVRAPAAATLVAISR
jgi:hypothetical protein